MDNSIWTVIISIATVATSASAWRFYEKKAIRKEKDEDFIRLDCKDRISRLEGLLKDSGKEKDDMRKTILKLTEQVASLAIKVEFLHKENTELHKVVNRMSGIKITTKKPTKQKPS
jgi:peptidoglycan hydrolase CwlO-like protein